VLQPSAVHAFVSVFEYIECPNMLYLHVFAFLLLLSASFCYKDIESSEANPGSANVCFTAISQKWLTVQDLRYGNSALLAVCLVLIVLILVGYIVM